jgi:hypothetical protein
MIDHEKDPSDDRFTSSVMVFFVSLSVSRLFSRAQMSSPPCKMLWFQNDTPDVAGRSSTGGNWIEQSSEVSEIRFASFFSVPEDGMFWTLGLQYCLLSSSRVRRHSVTLVGRHGVVLLSWPHTDGCCRLADLGLSSLLAAAIGCSYTTQSLFYLPRRLQQPSNLPSSVPIHKKNDALSAEKRDRLSLQPLEDSLQFQRWACLQNVLLVCLDAHSSCMMAVSVDTSIVTGSQPFLAGGLSHERIWHGWTPRTIVLQTDLVYIDVVHTLLVTSDCLSYECGLDQCLTCLALVMRICRDLESRILLAFKRDP